MDVLEKFARIEISNRSFIAPEDQQFVDQTEDQYQGVIAQLSQWQKALEKAERELGASIAYSIKNYGRADWEMRVSEDMDLGWAECLKFSPAFCYKYISESIQNAARKRNHVIIEYFKSKYHLTISADDLPKHEVLVEDILTFIISKNEGMSFVEKGEENLKNEFHNKFGWGGRTLKGDTISFENVRLSSYSSLDTHSDTWRSLIKAISFFEQGTFNQLYFVDESFRQLDARYPKYVNYSEVFDMSSHCKKVKSFKYYKNWRFDIKFHSKTLAAEFYEMFRLGQERE